MSLSQQPTPEAKSAALEAKELGLNLENAEILLKGSRKKAKEVLKQRVGTETNNDIASLLSTMEKGEKLVGKNTQSDNNSDLVITKGKYGADNSYAIGDQKELQA